MLAERFKHHSIGETKDIIHYTDGRVEVLEGHNAIVASYNTLVACLLKAEEGVAGITHWAIGEGKDTWDIPPACEVIYLKATQPCTTSGNISITLGGTVNYVSLTKGDSASAVMDKIAKASFSGWKAEREADKVVFTCLTSGPRVGETFNSGGTGVEATLTVALEGTDGTGRPEPTGKETKCVTEIYRKKILPENITFIDPITSEPTEEYTNIIEVRITFGLTEANGDWREFSIFGGNATELKDSGIAINYRTHRLISKASNMTIERVIRFTFQ